MGGVSDLKPTKLKPVIVFFKGHYQNKEFYIFKKIKLVVFPIADISFIFNKNAFRSRDRKVYLCLSIN